MLPAYILGHRVSETVEDAAPKVEVANPVFRRRLNRFYKGKWEAALQEKWILTVTCCLLFIGTTVIFILNVFTCNYAEASEDNVNLWWKIFTAEKNSGIWPVDPDTGDNELHGWEEELVDLREQITIAKETSNVGIFLGAFTLVVNVMGLVALVKENRDLLQWHGVTLGIDELMLMTFAGSMFQSSIRIQSSVNRLTYTYPTKGTCITKLVHYEGKCPVFLTLTSSAKFSALAASLGAILMAWVLIAYVQLYMTVLIGRQCKSGHEEESFVVTWYKDRLLMHKKPRIRKGGLAGFMADVRHMFGRGRSSAADKTQRDDSDIALAGLEHGNGENICTNVAVLIQEEITTTPVMAPCGSSPAMSSYRGSNQFLQLEPPVHTRRQRKKSFTLIPFDDFEKVTEVLKRKGSIASISSNYPTWEESEPIDEEDEEVADVPTAGPALKTVALVQYNPNV